MLKRIGFIAGLAAALFASAGIAPAAAQQQAPKSLGQFTDWVAVSYQADGKTVCYAITDPQDMQPGNVDHGKNFFLVTHRSDNNVDSEPQFMAGYALREGEKVTVTVDGKDFTFFSKENSAWVENAAEEASLIAAMKAGSDLSVKATSKRGTNTSYKFSLMGVTAALDAIDNCN